MISLIVFAAIAAAPPSEGEDLARRFRDEAPRAMAELGDRLQNFTLRGRMTTFVPDDPTLVAATSSRCEEFLVKTRGADTLVVMARNTGADGLPVVARRLIYGEKSKETFALRQTEEQGPLRRLSYYKNKSTPMAQTYRLMCIDGLAGGTTFRNRPLRERIAEPNFVIERAEAVDRDGRAMIRITFNDRAGEGDESPRESGHLIVSPDDKWAVCEFRSSSVRPGVFEWDFGFAFHLDTSRDGLPVVRRISHRASFAAAIALANRNEIDVDEWSYVETPESEFRVESYLGEGEKAEEQSPR